MKKAIVIATILITSLPLFSQERFYSLYPGWEIRYTKEEVGGYIFAGTDTLDFGYSNTPIYNQIDYMGNLLNTYRYVSDTIYGFSVYSPQSYSFHETFVAACGVYKEFTKTSVLNPILLYFNRENFYLDSIIDFKSYFNQRSALFITQKDNDEDILLAGIVQITMDWEAKTFFGIYNRVLDIFTFKEYSIPNHCQMTPYQLHPAHDGGYIISTEQDMTYLDPERVKACVVKIDAEGNEQWRYVIGPDSIATYRPRVFDAPDGNYYVVWTDPRIITSTLLQSNQFNTIRIAKLTDYGTYAELSEERDLYYDFGSQIRTFNIIYDCYQADDGTMYLLLESFSGYRSVLVKIFPNGHGAWLRSYRVFPENDPTYSQTMLYGISSTSDGGFMLTGEFSSDPGTMFPNGIYSALAIKVDSCGCLDAEGCNEHCGDSYMPQYIYMPEAEVFPNPANDVVSIKLPDGASQAEYNIKVYSLSGQLLQEDNTDASNEFIINISELPEGYYSLLVSGGGKMYRAWFVKEE